MELSAWHIWLIAGILLVILEMLSVDFLFAAFATACAAAGVAAAAGADINWQVGVFIIAGTISLALIRPLVKRNLYKNSDPRKTNIDAMIGVVGTVVEPTGPEDSPGRVKLGGEEWRSVSEDGSLLEPGERIEVTAVSGATVTVREIGR